MPASDSKTALKPWHAVAVMLLLTFAAGLLWRTTPLYSRLTPHRFEPWLQSLQGHFWTLPAMMALYVLAGLFLFVHAVLLWATVLTFDQWHSMLYAELGSIASGLFMYSLGRVLRPEVIKRLAGSYLERVSKALGKRGVMTLIVLHWFPICPFSVLNLLSGSTHIGTVDFLMGTIIGVTPGVVVLSVFGARAREALFHAHWQAIVGLAVFLIVGFFVLRFARRFVETREN